MGQRQVNIRMDDAELDVLEAAAFVEGRNLADVTRAAVRAHMAQLEADPEIAAAMQLRQSRRKTQAPAGSPVSSLEARRKRD